MFTLFAPQALGQSENEVGKSAIKANGDSELATHVPVDTAPPNPEPPIEVTVRGDALPAGTTTITHNDARNLAGALGDPFRTVEAQPGITPVISSFPYFFVRGAPPGNVGYLVDGVRVPMLYHAFLGPSVLHPAFIDRTVVYRGAYPATIGRYAGAVVSAETRQPDLSATGNLSLRLFDAGAMLSSPFLGDRGHIAVGGRYSYTALLLSELLLDSTRLEYWDYQTRVDYDLSRGGNIRLLAFGAHDLSGAKESNSLTSMDFHRVNARYSLDVRPGTRIETELTLGYDRTRTDVDSSITSGSSGARIELMQRATENLQANIGADLWIENYRSSLTSALQLQDLTGTGRDVSLGVFVETPWHPDRRVSITPGLRVDYFGTAEQPTQLGVDPRVSARFEVTRDARIAHSLGIAHQRPTLFPAALPAFQGASVGYRLQRSVQAASGVEVAGPSQISLSLTAFENIFYDVTDPLGTTGEFNPNTAQTRALGSSVGLEVYVRRPITKGLGGFFSYTLSRSTRAHGSIKTLSAYDRPHVASLALNYDLGRRWLAGTRVTAMSGVPTQRLTTEGPRFTGEARAPVFFRLDARLEKRWVISDRSWWALVMEVLNATASQEVVRQTCNDRRCQRSVFGPLVLPSLGVEATF